jgi:ATP-dependent RNA helicase SUPV3L1/SUV3
VRLGREAVYVPALLKPRARAAQAMLWAVHGNHGRLPELPPGDPLSVAVTKDPPRAFHGAVGYRVFGAMALRIDAVERVAALAHRLSQAGSFVPGSDFLALAGCDTKALGPVLTALGYRAEAPDAQGSVSFAGPGKDHRQDRHKGRRKTRGAKAKIETAINPDSPFAKLAGLRLSP